tara:strand:- start:84 stop:308 length:225 start_codon:yes stop_codon:yes gene_type:complete
MNEGKTVTLISFRCDLSCGKSVAMLEQGSSRGFVEHTSHNNREPLRQNHDFTAKQGRFAILRQGRLIDTDDRLV